MNADEASRPPLDRRALEGLPRWRVEVLAETGSTNEVLAERARAGAEEDVVVVTEHQTAGRGRLGRTWETPPGAALTFSVLLTPREVPQTQWSWLPLLAGVAVVDGVRRATGLECDLKWPNDVLAGHRKLAGILLERVESPAGPAAVVGIGINVSTREEELPVPVATSLAVAGAPDADRTELLVAVLGWLGDHYDAWRRAGGDAEAGFRQAYVARCRTIGQQVRVTLPAGDSVIGRVDGIDATGSLVVDGRTVRAGDVVHVRGA